MTETAHDRRSGEAGARDWRRGLVWATVSPVAYSMSSILGKNLLDSLRPQELLFWRFSIALMVLWPILLWRRSRGGPDPFSVAARVPLVALGVVFGIMTTIGFIGLDHLDVSLYIILFYVFPALVAAMSPLIGIPVGLRVWLALAVTLIGIALTVPDAFSSGTQADTFGVVVTLGGAVILAAWVVAGSRLITTASDGLVAMGWSLIGSWLTLALLASVSGLHTPDPGRVLAELVAFAIVPTIIGGATFYQALRSLPPALVSMIALLEPLLTIAWAVLLLDEDLRPIQVLGGALVLGGVLWAQRATATGDARRVSRR